MLILEAFSGNGDIAKKLNDKGVFTITVDYDQKYQADICKDVYDLSLNFYKQFNAIWLSPDCTTYSLASHGIHPAKGGVPVSDYAKYCDINNNVLINRLRVLGIPFIIENPRGHFRNMPFVKGLYRITIYFSTYGADYQKPTDLFSNVDISKFFDQAKTPGRKHLDYCVPYRDFLGRCKMPGRLIDDISECLIALGSGYYVD